MSLDELINSARTQIEQAADLDTLDSVRVEFLGKKGQVTAQLKSLGSLPVEEKKAQGQNCLLYTSPSPRDATLSRMPSSA